MSKDINSEFDELTGGSKLSRVLFVISMIFLVLSGITLFSKIQTIDPVSGATLTSETPWKIAGIFLFMSISTGYISYRLAGGRENPAIYKGKNQRELFNIMGPQKIPSYLFWAILLTFWCIPFGIVAIVYACQVRAYTQHGDFSRAFDASRKAKKWCWVSFLVGLAMALLILLQT